MCADAGFHNGTGRAARLPAAWGAYDNPGGFELGQVREKAIGIERRPAQRMVYLAGIHHLAKPIAVFRGALHRQQ